MSRTKLSVMICLTLICWTAAVVPAAAQYFIQLQGSLSYVAAGHNEVWGLQFPGGLIYRLNPSGTFYQVPGSLSQIAVGGGALFTGGASGLGIQPDEVWGVNGAGVFSFSLACASPPYSNQCPVYTQHNPPGAATYFSQIAVGEGDLDSCHPYEVWALASSVPASSGLPYRFNYCKNQFVQIPLPSGSTTPFTRIATAARGSDVWALDANAHIWHLTPCACAWTQIGGGYYGTLQQITVGVNDVWGRDGNGSIYRYNPYDSYFMLVQSENNAGYAMQIAAGGDGVWAIEGSDSYNGLRLDSLANQFVPVGSFWTQVAVGSGAGVFVINSSNQVFTWVRQCPNGNLCSE
jgi:hypothetical protein